MHAFLKSMHAFLKRVHAFLKNMHALILDMYVDTYICFYIGCAMWSSSISIALCTRQRPVGIFQSCGLANWRCPSTIRTHRAIQPSVLTPPDFRRELCAFCRPACCRGLRAGGSPCCAGGRPAFEDAPSRPMLDERLGATNMSSMLLTIITAIATTCSQ